MHTHFNPGFMLLCGVTSPAPECSSLSCLFLVYLQGEFVSMGVYSSGNSYGVPDDLIYSFPVTIKVSLNVLL